jgi:hypothetical protein
MFLGRFPPIVLPLAIVGSFTIKDRKEAIEPVRTHGHNYFSIVGHDAPTYRTHLLPSHSIRTVFNVIEMREGEYQPNIIKEVVLFLQEIYQI